MLKSTRTFQPSRLGEAAVNASRQVWLASLGAAVVTRDWVQTEAGSTFKALVREGSVVEAQAVRFVGDRLETSISMANTVWKETRRTVESTVRQAADVAVNVAQQMLPRSLPAFELPMLPKRRKAAACKAKPAKRAAKTAVRAASKTRHARKATTKRG